VPLTVELFTPGSQVVSIPGGAAKDTPAATYTTTTVDAGIPVEQGGTTIAYTVTFEIEDVPLGTYDITVVSPHTLVNVRLGADITSSPATIDMGTLLEGNCNDSYQIDGTDFSILAVSFFKGVGQEAEGYDPTADFDKSDFVDGSDFSLLAANFFDYSPIEVP